jgi:hypothetical protein
LGSLQFHKLKLSNEYPILKLPNSSIYISDKGHNAEQFSQEAGSFEIKLKFYEVIQVYFYKYPAKKP